MFLIGLSGGIATGKSTVSDILKEIGGCIIIDADLIAKDVVKPDKPVYKKIVEAFGSEVVLEDGTLDRALIGRIVFNDEVKRKLLNSITHPAVHKVIMKDVVRYFLRGEQFVILDIPLLFEGKLLRKYMKETVLVTCDAETQINRLMERNDLTVDEAQSRIDAQMPLTEKMQLADHIIDNNRSLDETRDQVQKLLKQFRQSKSHWKLRVMIMMWVFAILFLVFLLSGMVAQYRAATADVSVM